MGHPDEPGGGAEPAAPGWRGALHEVDLLSILPTYLSLIIAGSKYLLVIRVLRILHIFRVLQRVTYVGEADLLTRALWASRRKIIIFLFAVLTLAVIGGSLMYVIEGERNGFTECGQSHHDGGVAHCKRCGAKLD